MMNKVSEANDSNSIIQSETVEHLNSLTKKFYHYFSDVKYNTPLMKLTRNPFRLLVKDFSDDPNENIQEFLNMIHDSTAKASFEDES